MDRIFDNIWILRITAFILAVLLFFYVKASFTDDRRETSPNSQVDILTDVPLEVYYDSENLIVSGLPETVDVTIEGPVAIVVQTKLKKDYKVFVDLNSLLIGQHRVTIQTENFSDKLDVTVEPKTVDIVIEEKVTQQFKVEPEINNRLFAEGYILQSMTVEPSSVIVTGAKSVIESISYVKATVSTSEGINESFTREAAVKVLDSNLNKLDVIVEPQTVKVSVEVVEYSKSIPIKMKRTGRLPNGVSINRLDINLDSVKVYGPKSIIDSLEELIVEIDLSKVEASGEFEVNLNLPKGATRLGTEKVIVTADVTRIVNDPVVEETSGDAVKTEEKDENQEPEDEKNDEEVEKETTNDKEKQ